ncbi:MAG: putative Ig domain-containing protein [Bryobacteraceae bacterium]
MLAQASPVIGLSPTSLSFTAVQGGASPANQTVAVGNTGGGTLNWTAAVTSGASWLSLTGATTGLNSGTITVVVSPGSLPVGAYGGYIQVTGAPGTVNTPQNIGVTLTVTPAPAIGLSPASLAFTDVQGGSNPATQTVGIGNTGTGTLNWSAAVTSGAAWLSLSGATTGANGGAITAVVSVGGLMAGTYNGNIQVTAAGAANTPQNIPVTLTVGPPAAVIVLSPASLAFTAVQGGSTPANQTVGIANAGVGTLNWSAAVTSGAAWLSLSGTTAGANTGTITVVVNPGGLPIGAYSGNIQVTGGAGTVNTPQNIPVTLAVTQPPTIGLNPASLAFAAVPGGSNPANQTVGIANTGTGTMNWSASVTSGAPWLSLGGATSGVNGGTVTVMASVGGLAAGTYNGNIQVMAVGAANTPQNIPVIFTVGPPPMGIGLIPSSLAFTAVQGGANPANQTVGVANIGVGTMNWSAAVTSGTFLSLSGATSGTNGGTLTVAVSAGGLTAGTYNGNIQVTAPGATNTPQNIPVSLTVSPSAAMLVANPASLAFTAVQAGANPANQTVGISVAGAATLNWSAAVTSGSWLSLSGTTSGINSGTITAVVTLGALTAGTYNGNIQVTAPGASNSPLNISVTLTVASPSVAVIGVTQTSLAFTATQGGANPANQTIGVTIEGVGLPSWSAAVTGGSWLSLSGATSGGAGGTITAVVSVAGLTAATYIGNIQVTAPGTTNSPLNIPVTLTVTAPAPAIYLTSTSLAFTAAQGGSNPANQLVQIANAGVGTLNWSAAVTTGAAFLSLSGATSGTNSGTITAVVNVGSLIAGTYNGNIQVRAAGASNTPQNIPVILTVSPSAPVIVASPALLYFTTAQGGANPANQTVGIGIAGVGTLSWVASVGSGAAWLSLSGATSGASGGTITAAVNVGNLAVGTYNGTIQVAAAGAGNSPLNIPVIFAVYPANQPLTITSLAPRTVGTINSVYPATIVTATGGTVPYTWSATGLPPGISIDPVTGTITGTPTTNIGSPFAVQLTVTDSTGATASQSYSLTINAVLTVTGPPSFPAATLFAAYTATTVTAAGGNTPYAWSATGLPRGLSIGPESGTISGLPAATSPGTFAVQVTVVDTIGDSASRSYTLAINAPLALPVSLSLPAGIAGTAYTPTAVAVVGGNLPYTWSATGLPPGLSIGGITGIIAGTPTTDAGSPFTVQVTVTDSTGVTASSSGTLIVNPALKTLPNISGVSNAAGGQTWVAPNTLVSIYGSNFVPAGFTDDWSESIGIGELPTTLDGVSVNFGDQAAYVTYLSASQINVLLPDEGLGGEQLTVTTPVGTSTLYVNSQQYSPAFFTWPNSQPVATHLDYMPAAQNGTLPGITSVPAKPGEVIILWGTGFGPTTPPAPAGVPIPVSPRYNTVTPVAVTIGNLPAMVYGTALAPGFAGLYQLAVTVPASLPDGDYTVLATINGSQAPPVTLTVSN